MATVFLSLPLHVLKNICSFIEDETLLQLREVSKSTKDVIEASLNYRSTEVDCLTFYGEGIHETENTTQIEFTFQNVKSFKTWKIRLIFALTKNGIGMSRFLFREKILTVYVEQIKLKSFLEDAKQLFSRGKLRLLILRDTQHIDLYSTFLEDGSVLFVQIYHTISESSDSAALLQLLQHLHPEYLKYCPKHLTKDYVEFLLQLADFSSALSIYVTQRYDPKPDFALLLLNIFRKKCATFAFSLSLSEQNGILSMADIEMLLKGLHHIEKRVYLSTWTDEDHMDMQVGEYSVKTSDVWQNRRVVITNDY